jgi:hypothetical protein
MELDTMYVIRKLKPDRNFLMLLIPLSTLVVGAFLWAFVSLEAAFYFFAVFFWVYALYSFLTFARTGNSGFVVSALYQASAGWFLFTNPILLHRKSPVTVFFLVLTLFFLVWLIFLIVTKKIKWRGREVLELAAAPVEKMDNGYTPRPLPAGKTEFTQRQILAFAEFARKNLIAVTYVGKDKVVFVPVMEGRELGFILGLKSDYTAETWVIFDFNGNVSVNISHRDYLEYQQAFAFDQLCESLGNLFVEFMELFQRGEGVRIIDRTDALRTPYYS